MSRLCLSNNKKLAGVCAGIAECFSLDTATVRLVWIVLVFAGLGSPVLFYVLLWLLLPSSAKSRPSFEERMNKRLRR